MLISTAYIINFPFIKTIEGLQNLSKIYVKCGEPPLAIRDHFRQYSLLLLGMNYGMIAIGNH